MAGGVHLARLRAKRATTRCERSAQAGSWATRWRVWARSEDLDRALAAGVDPSRSGELALRAAQLTKPRTVRRFGSSLHVAIKRVERPGPLGTSLTLLRPDSVGGAREALLALACRLREQEPVGVRAAAMVSYLVRSGDSPLYARSAGRRLRNFARDASELIDAERARRRAVGGRASPGLS
jgi:hypothetical protein